jgi:diguanylate cyclase (GGDEF)-like protein
MRDEARSAGKGLSLDESGSDQRRIVEDVRRYLGEGWIGIGEVVERLGPDELRLLGDKPDPGLDLSRETLQRLVALVEMAQSRRERDPEPWSQGPARRASQVILAPHGTVAHELLDLALLLIEFDPIDTLRTIDLLREAKDMRFDVRSAVRVEDAPALLREGAVDAALLNLTRPAGSGPALLARAEVVSSGVPVIALINSEDEPQVIHLGARDYLVKSQLDARLLARTLRSAVEHRRLVVQLESAQRREHFYATRDTMTGLPNRHHFRDQLERSLHFAERHGSHVAVLFVDLDRFKEINDTLGHEVGDSLLITLSERLSASLRKSDMVARIGGDEFLLMLQGTDQDYVPARTAERLIDALSAPFVVDGQEHVLSASIGIATFPRDGRDPEALIRHADAAMYQAKADGRSSYRFYSQSVNAVTVRKRMVESRLRRVLERDELCIAYLPRVDARDGRILGAEALLRWNDAELGIIEPGEFIPIAEEAGLVGPIGEWVLCRACEEQRAWVEAGFGELVLSVNVSARQIRSEALRDAVVRAIAEVGIQPGRLELELTESALMPGEEGAARTLHELAELGVGVALDDFGTGFSSLSHLDHFPVTALKIDPSFVWQLDPASKAPSIVDAIVQVARTLDLAVVAEGVETVAQRDDLLARGCHEMQGFLFSRPVSPEALLRLLRKGERLRGDS